MPQVIEKFWIDKSPHEAYHVEGEHTVVAEKSMFSGYRFIVFHKGIAVFKGNAVNMPLAKNRAKTAFEEVVSGKIQI